MLRIYKRDTKWQHFLKLFEETLEYDYIDDLYYLISVMFYGGR